MIGVKVCAVRIVPAVLAAMVVLSAGSALAQQADGEKLFKSRCGVCHSNVPGKKSMSGPNLSGIVNRKAASTADFNYSTALKASGQTWSKAALDRYLAAPAKEVPGTRMMIAVPNPEQRAAIIAYLAGE